MANQAAGLSRSPWLWLGAGVAMILAIGVAIFDDDDEFGDFGTFAQLEGGSGGVSGAQSDALEDALSDAIQDALSGGGFGSAGGSTDGSGTGSGTSGGFFTQPDTGAEIAVLDVAGTATVLSVQDMLDGNGFKQTTATLAAEGDRERTGVLLEEILDKAEVEDWNRLRITGGLGVATEVDREAHDADPDQYLLYWSSDGDPSATVTLSNPQDGVRVIDVTDIIVVD